jgi:hypothetical protein
MPRRARVVAVIAAADATFCPFEPKDECVFLLTLSQSASVLQRQAACLAVNTASCPSLPERASRDPVSEVKPPTPKVWSAALSWLCSSALSPPPLLLLVADAVAMVAFLKMSR